MRKTNFIKPRKYFKRFRLSIVQENGISCFMVKGPLATFNYRIPQYFKDFMLHQKDRKLVWFDYSKLFLDWIAKAQRSVSVGYYIEMALNGVAYKVDCLWHSRALHLDLGYSHHLCILLPDEAAIKFEKRKFTVLSPDYVWLSSFTYKLKKLRWPDPYRGKGVVYKDEKIKLRPGKQRQ